jgi:hypothetical protein
MQKSTAPRRQELSEQQAGAVSVPRACPRPSLQERVRIWAERALTEERVAGLAVIVGNLFFWSLLFLWLH